MRGWRENWNRRRNPRNGCTRSPSAHEGRNQPRDHRNDCEHVDQAGAVSCPHLAPVSFGALSAPMSPGRSHARRAGRPSRSRHIAAHASADTGPYEPLPPPASRRLRPRQRHVSCRLGRAPRVGFTGSTYCPHCPSGHSGHRLRSAAGVGLSTSASASWTSTGEPQRGRVIFFIAHETRVLGPGFAIIPSISSRANGPW